MDQFGTETFSQKVDEILHLTQENNRMLRAQRRDKWLGFVGRIAVWIAILVASYYFTMQYIAPILNSVQQLQSVTAGFTGTKTTSTSSTSSASDLQKVMDLYNQYKGSLGQ